MYGLKNFSYLRKIFDFFHYNIITVLNPSKSYLSLGTCKIDIPEHSIRLLQVLIIDVCSLRHKMAGASEKFSEEFMISSLFTQPIYALIVWIGNTYLI